MILFRHPMPILNFPCFTLRDCTFIGIVKILHASSAVEDVRRIVTHNASPARYVQGSDKKL